MQRVISPSRARKTLSTSWSWAAANRRPLSDLTRNSNAGSHIQAEDTAPLPLAGKLRSSSGKTLLSLLEERGYIKEIAGDRDALDKLLSSKRIGAYTGIDPTAPSIHLGHLVPLMVLFWLYAHGHHTISLVGGATAQVGDPTGRLISRQTVQTSVHATNLASITNQVQKLWLNVEERIATHDQAHGIFECEEELGPRREVLNNATWMNSLGLIDFLKFMGTGARLGTMLGRDTVKNKLTQGDGMSFAEFTYPLLQAWDWWHMYNKMGVQVQIGGSDQYGNIVAGMDAIKHIAPIYADGREPSTKTSELLAAPIGLTVPLLTTSSGAKFGKSAGNAVWLDPTMTSAFDLYGFLLRSSDADVGRYLKLFTFLPLETINKAMEQHVADPGRRVAQHLLALEVSALVHGEQVALKTATEHQTLRRPTLQSLKDVSDASGASKIESEGSLSSTKTTPPTRVKLPHSLVYGTPMARILFHAGIVKTRSEGMRVIASGGVYVGSQKPFEQGSSEMPLELDFQPVTKASSATGDRYLASGNLLVLRTGKWKVKVIEVVDDADFDAQRLTVPGWDEIKESKMSGSS